MMAGFQAEENLTGRAPKKMCEKFWTLSSNATYKDTQTSETDFSALAEEQGLLSEGKKQDGQVAQNASCPLSEGNRKDSLP